MPVSDVGLAVTVLLLLAGLWLWLRDELLTRLSLENRSVLTIDATQRDGTVGCAGIRN